MKPRIVGVLALVGLLVGVLCAEHLPFGDGHPRQQAAGALVAFALAVFGWALGVEQGQRQTREVEAGVWSAVADAMRISAAHAEDRGEPNTSSLFRRWARAFDETALRLERGKPPAANPVDSTEREE